MRHHGAALLAAALAACTLSQPAAPPPTVARAPAAMPEWTMFRGDLARDGHPPAATLGPAAASRLHVSWRVAPGGALSSQPVVTAGIVVVAAESGALRAFNNVTGALLWTAEGLGPLSGQPLIYQGEVFVGSGDGHLYAFDLLKGERSWDWRAPGGHPAIWSGPALYRGLLLVGAGPAAGEVDGGSLAALDPASGDRFWVTCLRAGCGPGDSVRSSIAVDGSGYGYVGRGAPEGGLAAFDVGIGRVVWTAPMAPVDATPLLFSLSGRSLVAVRTQVGGLAALDPASGAVVWARNLPGPASGSPAFDGQSLYLPLAGLVALNPSGGTLRWRSESSRSVLSSPAVGNGVVVYGEGSRGQAGGAIVALATDDGHQLWRYETGAPVVASPVIVGDTVYAADLSGRLFAFRP